MSYNWSGYYAGSATPFTAAKSTYVQPAVKCAKPGAYSFTVFWVGLDGWTDGTVEQAGTSAICTGEGSGHPPVYFAWWEMYPTNAIQAVSLLIKPGDRIEASVTYAASTADYVMTVANMTTHKRFTETAKCASDLMCERSSAEWIVERPSGYPSGEFYNLADWGKMPLTDNKAASSDRTGPDGETPMYKNPLALNITPINMIDFSFNPLAGVGPMSGTTFSDTWEAES